MTAYKVVVDGSNVATEGRTRPSLSQLDEAVRSFLEEYPNADVIVIVDSSFPNRIDPADVAVFEEAFLAGEIITPPAGTVGRGDAFILKVADKLGATVFSNDSFQEFHGTYEWLFEKGRLVGGKPIPGLGWVFTPRVPVRGQKSREAVRESKRQTVRVGSPEAMRPMPVPKAPPPFQIKDRTDEGSDGFDAASDSDNDVRRRRKKRRGSRDGSRDGRDSRDNRDNRASRGDVVVSFDEDSIDQAGPGQDSDRHAGEGRSEGGNTQPKRRQRGRVEGSVAVAPRAVNEPGTFLTFIASHLPGSAVQGTVEDYASHGFYVTAGGARCYVPLSGLAEPMPRSAKEVVRRGESRDFIVKAFDAARRGIELALVGTPGAGDVHVVAAIPTTDESAKKGRGTKAAKVPLEKVEKKVATKKAPAKKVATKKVAVKKSPAKKTAAPNVAIKKAPATAAAPAAAKKSAAASKSTAAKNAVSSTGTAPFEATAPKSTSGTRASSAKSVASVTKASAQKVAAPKVSATKAVAAKARVAKVVPGTKAAATKAVVAKAPVAKAAPGKEASATKAVSAKAPVAKVAPGKEASVKKPVAVKTAVKKASVTKASVTRAAVTKAAVTKAPVTKAAVKK